MENIHILNYLIYILIEILKIIKILTHYNSSFLVIVELVNLHGCIHQPYTYMRTYICGKDVHIMIFSY